MKYKTVLFDLDGTLIDTNELIITSFLYTLRTFFPERTFSRRDVIPHLGKPLRDMFAHFQTDDAENTVEDMVDVYRGHNMRTHDEMVQAFPYVSEVIPALYDQGVHMGIVTTKQRTTAEMGLRLCELERYMRAVITLEDVRHPKPHPEPIFKAMSELGAEATSTLMVGDNQCDIEAAAQAGIDSAGVSWALKGEAHLRSAQPTYMLKDMRDLYAIVGIQPGRRGMEA